MGYLPFYVVSRYLQRYCLELKLLYVLYVDRGVVLYRLISLVEFQAFESLLCAPDAISQLSFKLFDVDKTGKVSYGT